MDGAGWRSIHSASSACTSTRFLAAGSGVAHALAQGLDEPVELDHLGHLEAGMAQQRVGQAM
jgi:hypothetical protein